MARRNQIEFEPQDEPGLDIASLIDVSFLLLIYFLVTTTLQKKETDLGLTLPADTPKDAPFKLDPMTIKIEADGAILVNKEQVEPAGERRGLPELLQRLASFKKLADSSGQKPVVIVVADDTAKQQRFVDVINTLAAVEIKTVTISGFRT